MSGSSPWSSRFSGKPVDEAGNQITGIGVTRNQCHVPRPRNPDLRQRRHQPSAGDVDLQHGQRADPNAEPIRHRLTRYEEVIEYLARKSGKMLKPCRCEPVRPIAGTGFACKQRVSLDVGGLQDRPLREQRRTHDQRIDIVQHRNDAMLRPRMFPGNAAPDRHVDAAAQFLEHGRNRRDHDFDLRMVGM